MPNIEMFQQNILVQNQVENFSKQSACNKLNKWVSYAQLQGTDPNAPLQIV